MYPRNDAAGDKCQDEETRRIQEVVERFENNARRFAPDYQRQREELETRLVQTEREAGEPLGAATTGKFVVDPYLLALLASVVVVSPAFVIPKLRDTIPELGAAAIPKLGVVIPLLSRVFSSLIRWWPCIVCVCGAPYVAVQNLHETPQ